MRGRKPKPTALKLVGGNAGKRPIAAAEPIAPIAIPTCPPHLQGEAKAEWRRITRELESMRVLSRVDRASLAAYCQAWARWVEAEQMVVQKGTVVKSPSGYPIQNPYLAVANKALEQVIKIAAEFGLTPVSRARVKVEATPKPQDPMELFLNRAKA